MVTQGTPAKCQLQEKLVLAQDSQGQPLPTAARVAMAGCTQGRWVGARHGEGLLEYEPSNEDCGFWLLLGYETLKVSEIVIIIWLWNSKGVSRLCLLLVDETRKYGLCDNPFNLISSWKMRRDQCKNQQTLDWYFVFFSVQWPQLTKLNTKQWACKYWMSWNFVPRSPALCTFKQWNNVDFRAPST